MHWLDTLCKEIGLEAYGALAMQDVEIINERLLSRENFAARSILVFLVPYYATETVNLSRYSAARDYHIAIREITDRLIGGIKRHFPNANAKGYGDHSPIAERAAALRAGLGILGDNGLIIHEKFGSYVFIGDVITDLAPEELCAKPPVEIKYCEHCGKCKKACPTGVLRGEGEDCLSAITQKKGELDETQRIGNEIFAVTFAEGCSDYLYYLKKTSSSEKDTYDLHVYDLSDEDSEKIASDVSASISVSTDGKKVYYFTDVSNDADSYVSYGTLKVYDVKDEESNTVSGDVVIGTLESNLQSRNIDARSIWFAKYQSGSAESYTFDVCYFDGKKSSRVIKGLEIS